MAVQITLHRTVTICSVYLPPNDKVKRAHLENLISQLPQPVLILGDLNGHSTLWGCSDKNKRGEMIEKLLEKSELCLLNDKSSTYLHPATGHYSSLDLVISSPNLYLDYNFAVHEDLCGSEHFPIFLKHNVNSESEFIPKLI